MDGLPFRPLDAAQGARGVGTTAPSNLFQGASMHARQTAILETLFAGSELHR